MKSFYVNATLLFIQEFYCGHHNNLHASIQKLQYLTQVNKLLLNSSFRFVIINNYIRSYWQYCCYYTHHYSNHENIVLEPAVAV